MRFKGLAGLHIEPAIDVRSEQRFIWTAPATPKPPVFSAVQQFYKISFVHLHPAGFFCHYFSRTLMHLFRPGRISIIPTLRASMPEYL